MMQRKPPSQETLGDMLDAIKQHHGLHPYNKKPPSPSLTRMFKHVHAPVVFIEVSTNDLWWHGGMKPGNAYNYGIGKPNFPMPATRDLINEYDFELITIAAYINSPAN